MAHEQIFDHLGNSLKSFPRGLKLGKNDKKFSTSAEIQPRLKVLYDDRARIKTELEESRVLAGQAAMNGADTKPSLDRQAYLERTLQANQDATSALEARLREVLKREKLEAAHNIAADKLKAFEKEQLPKIKDLMKKEFQRQQDAMIFRLENPGIGLPPELEGWNFPLVGKIDLEKQVAALLTQLK